jgi:hypothetical protein
LKRGFGTAELMLSTKNLAPGNYIAQASAMGLQSYSYTFSISPPRPGTMPVNNSPLAGPSDIGAYQRIGVNQWTVVMPYTSGHTPPWPNTPAAIRGLLATDPSLPRSVMPSADINDQMVRANWFYLQGVQSRQLSFGFYHSIPEQVDETLRKHLIYAQLDRRFPSTLGLIFDYDMSGTQPYGYHAASQRDAAQRDSIRLKRWAKFWADAKAQGATDAESTRYYTLFNAGMIDEDYRKSIEQLHAAIPEQRHSTSLTPDHSYIQEGLYLPVDYRSLDFRYLDVWNDQIYANTAHDMQESFWTALLRMEKPGGAPLWVTVPTAPQPGTHLRRSLEAISHGATGTGYSGEGGAGLTGGWGAMPASSDRRTAQEALTGEMAKKYGAWINRFSPNEEVAILYSASTGGNNWGLQSPYFFAFFTFAQMNRPARLLTEDEVAKGALQYVKALVLVKQVSLPKDTLQAIEKFAAAGGKVLCDRDTKIAIKGATKIEDVYWPDSLWPNGSNLYHELIQDFPRRMGDKLKQFLGDVGKQPLEPVAEERDAPALVATKRAGDALMVFITNNYNYPFEQALTEDQRTSSFFRRFMASGMMYYKDVRVPCKVVLQLRPDLAAGPLHIYDAFAGKELSLQRNAQSTTVTVDLATQLGRVLLITKTPITRPTVSLAARESTDALATLVVNSTPPLPISNKVGNQEVFRVASDKARPIHSRLAPKKEK